MCSSPAVNCGWSVPTWNWPKYYLIAGHTHSMYPRRGKCNRCPFRLTRWWARAYLVTRVKSRHSRTGRWCARSQCHRPLNMYTPGGRAASKCGTSASPAKHQSANWIVWWVGNCRRFIIFWYFYFGHSVLYALTKCFIMLNSKVMFKIFKYCHYTYFIFIMWQWY